MIIKRKKNTRQSAGTTHGWGSMKKHRGAGNRGGRGMAGSGKRADTKKPLIWKNKKYFGRHGFKMHGAKPKINPINLSYFEEKADKLLEKKQITKEGDNYIIDAEKLGYNKILGTGKLTKKLQISASYFSKGAIEKIEKAGGKANQTRKKVEPLKEIKKEETKQPEKPEENKQVEK